jgi:hypothetical protein
MEYPIVHFSPGRKPFKDSSLFYELGMLIGGILILPIAHVHGALEGFCWVNQSKTEHKHYW